MRAYAKRTKSTAAKTYRDYIRDRKVLERKGVVLTDPMTKVVFEERYSELNKAKKAGKIKSQPYQELMSKERLLSARAKSYRDYLVARDELENKKSKKGKDKGVVLKEAMTERAFYKQYRLLTTAKKAGEIKSQPFQELMRRERYLTLKQREVFAKANEDLTGEKTTVYDARKFGPAKVLALASHINSLSSKDKEELFGGRYE